jgi:uncharacterized phiE125 gp8 family phage protein
MLLEQTAVPSVALPVVQFKEHLRLGSGFSDDGLQDTVLEGFLRAALAAIEARTDKILIERDFSWTLEDWRSAEGQALPVAPVSAIIDVALVDRLGGETVLAQDRWRLVPDAHAPRLVPVGTLLPGVPFNGSIRIRFMAGYGPTWEDLPSDLAQAALMLAAHYYEFRYDNGGAVRALPFGIQALIARYRGMRLSMGRGQ